MDYFSSHPYVMMDHRNKYYKNHRKLASTTVTGIQVVITVTLCRMTGVQVTITVTLCRMTVAQVTIPVTLCRMTSAQVVITVTLFRVWLFFNESLKLKKNYKSKIA